MNMERDTFILLGVKSSAAKNGTINYTVSFATNNSDNWGFKDTDGLEAGTNRIEENDYITLKSFNFGDVLSGVVIRNAKTYKLELYRVFSSAADKGKVKNVFKAGDSK